MTGDRYLPGVPCWVDVASPDSRVSTAFYGGLFGWEFDGLIARLDGRAVAGIGPPGAASWRTHVRAGEGTEERIDVAGGRALPERLFADDAGVCPPTATCSRSAIPASAGATRSTARRRGSPTRSPGSSPPMASRAGT